MERFFRKFYWVVLDLVLINFSLILSLILRFGQDWAQHFYEIKELFVYFLHLILSLPYYLNYTKGFGDILALMTFF